MHTSRYKRGYPHGDVLGGDARAVIEADFEEITTGRQPPTLMQRMKEVFQWIRKRLRNA